MIPPRIKSATQLTATARPSRRSRRGACLRVESLEGRALLATAAFESTFGQGGVVTGLLDTGKNFDQDDVAAVAGDAKGKTVVAGYAGFGGDARFTVRRYNVNGSVDTTFGTNGVTSPPQPGTPNPGFVQPVGLSIGANGSIALVTRSLSSDFFSIVVQLTPNGRLDSNFGTNGEYTLGSTDNSLNMLYSVAVQPDGKIFAAGVHYDGSSSTAENELLAVRLTTAGTLDTTFNGTGIQTLHVPGATTPNSQPSLLGSAVAVAPSGQIYLGTNLYRSSDAPINDTNGEVARLNADGTLDTSFAALGHLRLSQDMPNTLVAIAVGADNKLVVAGRLDSIYSSHTTAPTKPFLVRYLTNGVADPTFRGIPIVAASLLTGPREAFTSVAIGTDGTVTVGGYRPKTGTSNGVTSEGTMQFLAAQFTATGQVNTSFGVHGQMTFSLPGYPDGTLSQSQFDVVDVALTPSNNVVLLGQIFGADFTGLGVLARLTPTLVLNNATNDYDGDGKSDVAAELTNNATFAYRKSNGTGDVLQQFGQAGLGASIPAPGDYDGDGKGDIAVYLPALGALAYRSSYSGKDVLDFFGPSGTGASIPAPGGYDGDGRTDVAVYIALMGAFAIQPTGGGANRYVPFGAAGAGASIPAPGDYDGDGRTDFAVYIPSQGILAYRPSSGGPDVKVSFGPIGAGASIPAPGDYDGDGKTDVAIYMPRAGAFAIHPSSGLANILIPFGLAGTTNIVPIGSSGPTASIPAPGDGDGKTDAAVYMPLSNFYAYRPSGGGGDVVRRFGNYGVGQTIPAAAILYGITSPVPAAAPGTGFGGLARPVSSAVAPAILIPLTDDMSMMGSTTTAKQKATPA